MKKIILTSAFIFSAVAASFAQDGSSTGNVKLNVIIKPIQTLVVNNTDGVNLVYDSKEDYDKGVTSIEKDHLSVYSIGAYNVTVKSEKSTLNNTKIATQDIESSGILLTAETGSGSNLAKLDLGENIPLSPTATEIIKSDKGGVNKNFNITYKGEGGDSYVSKYFKENGGESVYSTTVTYTIAAQ